MDNSSDTVLTKKSCSLSCCFDLYDSYLFYCIIKTTPLDVESCEEQDGNKHKFVGGMTTKIWPNLRQGYRREMKMKDLNPAEEGDFPCKLR